MKIMDLNMFFRKYIEKDFEEQYVPRVFEIVCRQYPIRMNRVGMFDVVSEYEIGYIFYKR